VHTVHIAIYPCSKFHEKKELFKVIALFLVYLLP
jgi:hypothetical protein